jgi:CHAT domain-containing protein/Tfp pilus assembly protein PilF
VGALYGGWGGRRGTLIKRIQRLLRSILLVILIAGAAIVVPRSAPADDSSAEAAAALQNQVATLFQQGRYGEIEPLLKRLIAISEEHAGPNSPRTADSLGFLADFYEMQGRYDAAEPTYRRVLAIREMAPGQDRLDLGGALNGLAGLYKLEGRYADAENFYRRALEIVEAAKAPPAAILATILSNLALIYQNEGRYDEAEPLYRRAMTVAGENPETDRLLGPVIRNNLAGLYKEQHRYAEAEPLYAGVLRLREAGPTPPLDLAASLNNLASVYDSQGKYTDAEPLYQQALKLREAALGDDHPDVAQSLNNLAGIYLEDARYDKAEPLLQQALAIRQKTLPPDHLDIATALNNLAALYWADGRRDDALKTSGQAIAVLEAHLIANGGDESPAAIAEIRKSRVYFANYIGIAYGAASDRPDRQAALAADTFRVVQLAQASDAAQAVAAMAARFAAGSGALASAIRARQDLAAHLRQLDSEIVAAVVRPQPARRPDADAALRSQLTETREALAERDRQIAAQYPDYAKLTDPRPLPITEVQTLLAGDEALLVYLATAKETWFWAVRRDSATLYRADLGASALAADVKALRVTLTPDLAPYPASKAFELYRQIIAPAQSQLAGVHCLIVVPDGALQSLPFAILVTQRPESDPKTLADNRAIAWLARDDAISVLPAVSSLRALRQGGASQIADAPFLGVGDPVLTDTPAAADLRELPALPETAEELRAVAKTLGASADDLLLGSRASEAVLRQLPLDRYRVIEFATHGLLSGDLKGLTEAALVLTPPERPGSDEDGLLTASKIATLKLNADWVVLSACNTAGQNGTPDAGGLSGLAKAFFYAGARSLLVSHWAVWSKATVKLVTGVFEAQRKDPGIGRAEALRRAEISMLDPNEPPEFAHPFAWAPFVLAGADGSHP